jgi:hypothetical protein
MFTVTLNGTTLEYPTRELAQEFKEMFEENLWNEVGEVEYKPEHKTPAQGLEDFYNSTGKSICF